MVSLIFNKYEKIRRIAQGGMGDVFLARQKGPVGFDRLVILKSLRDELCNEKEFVDQFLDEARVAATLNHPNIVGLYEVGEWEGTYYMAMEFIDGEDLSRLWYSSAKRGVGLPFNVSVQIVHDAAVGLAHAHAARDVKGNNLNIVHRDVSPQNIMVRGDGVTKVVDFGIAKASNRVSKTAAGTVKGKLNYMSPEQVRGEALDGRSDQFSLGIVLWEMCTGKRLFKSASDVETINRILQSPIPKPSSVVPSFPPELEYCILKMLERDPSKRYRSCAQAARELKAYLDGARRQGATSVEGFVQEILGEELRKRTADLTPEPEEPSLKQTPAPGEGLMLKKENGHTLTLSSMGAVQQAILAGECTRGARLFKDAKWQRLDEIESLSRFFEVASAVQTHERASLQSAPASTQKTPKRHVLRGTPDENYPAEEETFVAEAAPDEEERRPPEIFGGNVDHSNDPFGTPGAAVQEDYADVTVPGVQVPPPSVGPDTEVGVAVDVSLPDAAASEAYELHLPPPVPDAVQRAPKLPNTLPTREPGAMLDDVGPASTQWKLGDAIAEAESLPQKGKKRHATLWIVLGIFAMLVLAGVVFVLNPKLLAPYFKSPSVGETQKNQGEVKPAQPPAIDEVKAEIVQALRQGNLMRKKALGERLSKRSDVSIKSAASLLYTEAARELSHRVIFVRKERSASMKEADSLREKAFSLVTSAKAKSAENVWAALAMAAYQSERLADLEMNTELQLLSQVAKGSADEALMKDENDRVIALALLNRVLKEGKSSAEKRVEIEQIAKRFADDKRISSAALLSLTQHKKLPADFDERVKAHFDEVLAKSVIKANARKARLKNRAQAEEEATLTENENTNAPFDLNDALTRAQNAQANGRTRTAVALYKRVLRKEPRNAKALSGIGWAYIDQQNRAGARRVFSRALKASPEYPQALFGMAEAYKESKQYSSAKGYYERFLATSPKGADARVAKIALEKVNAKLKSAPPAPPKPAGEGKSIEDVLKDNAAALSGEKSATKDSDTQEKSD